MGADADCRLVFRRARRCRHQLHRRREQARPERPHEKAVRHPREEWAPPGTSRLQNAVQKAPEASVPEVNDLTPRLGIPSEVSSEQPRCDLCREKPCRSFRTWTGGLRQCRRRIHGLGHRRFLGLSGRSLAETQLLSMLTNDRNSGQRAEQRRGGEPSNEPVERRLSRRDWLLVERHEPRLCKRGSTPACPANRLHLVLWRRGPQ